MYYFMINKLSLCIFILSIVGFSIFSLSKGQDANWDFKNYHYYNAYSVLNNRMDYDIAPAQVQSFYNPAPDIIPYLLVRSFPPYIFSLAMGAWQGLNIWLLFLVGRELLIRLRFPNPTIWAIICSIVGATGSLSLSEVGTTLNDLTQSVFLLTSVLFYLKADLSRQQSMRERMLYYFSASGFMLGLVAGLKLTFVLYLIGMGLAMFVVQFVILREYKAFLLFLLAAGGAFMLAAGPWMWVLWEHYGSPLFPYYNAIFNSPYAVSSNMADARFFPKNIEQALIFPLGFNLKDHFGMEIGFMDYRILALYVTLIVTGIYTIIYNTVTLSQNKKDSAIFNTKDYSIVWLVIFISTSYILWLKMFAIYRYLNPIELLSPIAIACISSVFNQYEKALQTVLATVFIGLMVFTDPPDFGSFKASDDNFFGVKTPTISWPEDAVVLMTSTDPLSYVIPSFPEAVRFVRIEGNFPNISDNTALTNKIKAIIAKSLDKLYLLTSPLLMDEGVAVANAYIKDHKVEADQCWRVESKLDSLKLCALKVSGVGDVSVKNPRRDRVQHPELLKNPKLDSPSGWVMGEGVEFTHDQELLVSVEKFANQRVPVTPDEQYILSVKFRCSTKPGALGRVQVNWIDSNDKLINADIKVNDCQTNMTEYSMEVIAPSDASFADVYVAGHSVDPVLFKELSFKSR